MSYLRGTIRRFDDLSNEIREHYLGHLEREGGDLQDELEKIGVIIGRFGANIRADVSEGLTDKRYANSVQDLLERVEDLNRTAQRLSELEDHRIPAGIRSAKSARSRASAIRKDLLSWARREAAWSDFLFGPAARYASRPTPTLTTEVKMFDLRSKVIRLAHAKPELRSHLLPLLKEAALEHAPTAYLNRRQARIVLVFHPEYDAQGEPIVERRDERIALNTTENLADMLSKGGLVVTPVGKTKPPTNNYGEIAVGMTVVGDIKDLETRLRQAERMGMIKKVVAR